MRKPILLALFLALITPDTYANDTARITPLADVEVDAIAPGDLVPMADLKYYTLDVEGSVAAGDPTGITRCRSLSVQTSGTFTATMKLEVSYEATGTNYFQVESDVTAAGKTVIDDVPYGRRLRVNTTAYTSGTATMTLQCLYDGDMESVMPDVSATAPVLDASAVTTSGSVEWLDGTGTVAPLGVPLVAEPTPVWM